MLTLNNNKLHFKQQDFNDNFFILLFDQIHLTDSGYYIITDNTDL